MGAPLLRVRTTFREVLFFRRGDVGLEGAAPLPRVVALFELAHHGPRDRAERGSADVRICTSADRRVPATDLVDAVRSGDVVAIERPLRRVVKLREAPEALGPASESVQEDFLEVLVFDAAGAPITDSFGVTVDATLGDDPKNPLAGLPLAKVRSIPTGHPSACRLSFHGLERTESVPADAQPAADAIIDTSKAKGAIIGPTRVTRSELASAAQAGQLSATNVFQLRRRQVHALELEHFPDGGALLWPGLPPAALALLEGAASVRGIDALASCLASATGVAPASLLVAGHGSTLAKERAESTKALLVKDRAAWVAIAAAHGTAEDAQAILAFASDELGWATQPGPFTKSYDARTSKALRAFQDSYNKDLAAGWFEGNPALAVDGTIGPQTWGAFFDVYARVLFPPAVSATTPAFIRVDREHQTYPVALAKLAAPGQDAARWTDLNALNPKMVAPSGGWHFPHVGQRIYVPDDWDLAALGAAGYATTEKSAPAPGSSTPPAPLPKATLVAVGCGAHHLVGPAKAAVNRRAKERHVEVLFFDPNDPAPMAKCGDGSGPCSSKVCELYDPREIDLAYAAADAATPSVLEFFVFPGKQDGLSAVATLEAAWGDSLRLGWLALGNVSRVHLACDEAHVTAEVTGHELERDDDHVFGSVPLVVPPQAYANGAAEYRLKVTFSDGAIKERRVRVNLPGPAPSPLGFRTLPLLDLDEAAALGLGIAAPLSTLPTTAPAPAGASSP